MRGFALHTGKHGERCCTAHMDSQWEVLPGTQGHEVRGVALHIGRHLVRDYALHMGRHLVRDVALPIGRNSQRCCTAHRRAQ